MQLDERDREMIVAWNDVLNREVALRLLSTEDERNQEFESFGRTLSELAPAVRFTVESNESGEFPAFAIGQGWRYHLIPSGNELGPFLELLSIQVKGRTDLPSTLQETLEMVEWPANFTVYVTAGCPFCPEVVRQIQPFPMVNPNIRLNIVDGASFPELAQREQVRSAPTVILDGGFRWTGSIVLQELLDALVHRDPARMSSSELVDIVKEGNAVQLAQMMLDRGVIFPGFLELLRHPNWSERLGGMVVLEQIAEEDQDLAKTVCGHLLSYLEAAQDPVKGDLIYLLGAVGCAEAVAPLEKLLVIEKSLENREVIVESLEKLKIE